MKSLTGWTIVFDLDGTLVDTAPDLVNAMNHAMTSAGYQPAPYAFGRQFIGGGAKAMLRAAARWQDLELDEDEVHRLWETFIPYYRANIAVDSVPFHGCLDALTALEKRGAKLAVCTNKTQALTDQLLDTLGLTDRFISIIGSDSVPSKKPDGDHIYRTIEAAGGVTEKSLMVGDSTTDEGAAKDLGVPLIFVEFGYGPEPEQDAVNVFRLADYDGLVPLVERLTD